MNGKGNRHASQDIVVIHRKMGNKMYNREFKLPRYREIPDVGLLLDQAARLVNGYLEPFEDIRLTNSMISNYVKHNIISRPIKKLYYREQLASLIFIAIAKTVLSLEDTAVFLSLQHKSYTPEAAYNLFCDGFEAVLRGGDTSTAFTALEYGSDAGQFEQHEAATNGAGNRAPYDDASASGVYESVQPDDVSASMVGESVQYNSTAAAANAQHVTVASKGKTAASDMNKAYGDRSSDSLLLAGLLKAAADCIRLKELLAAYKD